MALVYKTRALKRKKMNNILIEKSYYVEVVTPIAGAGAAQQTFFPILDNLKGKFLQGISVYPVGATPKSQGGSNVANNALLKSTFLTLVTGNENDVWNIALIDLVQLQTPALGFTNPTVIEFNNLSVIWGKCYLFVADLATYAIAQEVWAMNIKYTDQKI